jgi:serine protease Do
MTHGKVKRSYLGIVGFRRFLDRRIVRYHNLRSEYAVEVASVDPKGPANESGVIQGDIIVAINDHEVKSIDDICRVLAEWAPGQVLKIQRVRGKSHTIIKVVPVEA